ncbi:4'-phosphopantetheinyl transferase family protein [Streptomyces sp. URMC 123]|uniref:4'-phosphopantetheinyl transferase family protein n=1 Tax=Streptomyces sp. URMC 123 TaxID=3423403 RepID=UPI003F1BC30A
MTAVEAWLVDLAAHGPAPPGRDLAGLLAEDERRRAAAFVHEEPARRFVAARLALRELLGSRLGERPGAVRIAGTPAGKPYLPDHPGLGLSWSRSRDLLLLALAENAPVGVDIEELTEVPEAAEVLATVCPALPAVRDAVTFLRAWTLLEAAVKATGRGLAHGAREVDLALDAGGGVTLRGIAGGVWPSTTRWLTPGSGPPALASFVCAGDDMSLTLHE